MKKILLLLLASTSISLMGMEEQEKSLRSIQLAELRAATQLSTHSMINHTSVIAHQSTPLIINHTDDTESSFSCSQSATCCLDGMSYGCECGALTLAAILAPFVDCAVLPIIVIESCCTGDCNNFFCFSRDVYPAYYKKLSPIFNAVSAQCHPPAMNK